MVMGLLLAACNGVGTQPAAGAAGERSLRRHRFDNRQTGEEGRYTLDGYTSLPSRHHPRGGIRIGESATRSRLNTTTMSSIPQRVAPLYKKLITWDESSFLLGPYTSALTAAAVPVAEKYHIPLVDAHGSAESIFTAGTRSRSAS